MNRVAGGHVALRHMHQIDYIMPYTSAPSGLPGLTLHCWAHHSKPSCFMHVYRCQHAEFRFYCAHTCSIAPLAA